MSGATKPYPEACQRNQAFDAMLRTRDPASGIRDVADLVGLAAAGGLGLERDHAMPANNRLLIWRKAP